MATTASTTAADILAHLGQDFAPAIPNLAGSDYTLPSKTGNPLYDTVSEKTLDDLTSGAINGTGAFDKLMTTLDLHLKAQYDSGRITGELYSKTYVQLTSGALTAALQFLLQADSSYWQAITAQALGRKAEIDAVTAGVALEQAKQGLHEINANIQLLEAQHAVAQMQLASADVQVTLGTAQVTLTGAQTTLAGSQDDLVNAQVTSQGLTDLQTTAQTNLIDEQTITATNQGNLALEQIKLVGEQFEAQRAQTMDTRSDGTTAIVGLIGQQKDLYGEQKLSYEKDAKYKVAKLYTDSWITQKTLDEGLVAPTEFQNAAVDAVLASIRATNSLT